MAQSTRKRAVIIESQRLFMPFLLHAVEATGAKVVATERRANPGRLSRLQPDVVLLDATQLASPPLVAIRTIRSAAPNAMLVVFAPAEAAWCAVARGLGADVLLGYEAGRSALNEAFATAL